MYRAPMNRLALVPIVLCCLAGSSAWATECMNSAGDPKTGWYAWREIDGRKCWFKKTGAMPPKSQLHWPAKAERDPPLAKEQVSAPVAENVSGQAPEKIAPAAVSPRNAEAASPQLSSGTPHIKIVRVKPVPSPVQARPNASADPFGARFAGSNE